MTEEQHPLAPFVPSNGKILMLGSFPPPKSRWKMDFYYPNLQNDMWRIFGLVFFQNKDYFLTEDKKNFKQNDIIHFLEKKGIGISDTAFRVIRLKENASDKFLQIEEKVNLKGLLESMPECRHVITTGEKAAETLQSIVAPELEIPSPGNCFQTIFEGRELSVWRMPSSSRAYPKPLPEKAACYRRMFELAGLV
ncbi:MAG: uracil-DNA glycosylase family protein [Dysgonamonadaceae bacterium]